MDQRFVSVRNTTSLGTRNLKERDLHRATLKRKLIVNEKSEYFERKTNVYTEERGDRKELQGWLGEWKKARRTMRRAPAEAANFITSGPRILQSNLLPDDEIADHADDVSQLSREPTESNRPATPLMSDFNKRLNPFSLFFSLPSAILYPRLFILLLLFALSRTLPSSSPVFPHHLDFHDFSYVFWNLSSFSSISCEIARFFSFHCRSPIFPCKFLPLSLLSSRISS